MQQQSQYILTAVIALRRARVPGQPPEVGEIAQGRQHQGGYDHAQHELGQRHLGYAGHYQYAGIGGQDALGYMAHPAGDKSLLLGFKITLGRVLHYIRT